MKKNNTAKIIGVSGGKGGTGKSTVACALACGLAQSYKVLLVDADVDCPNDHLLLDIKRNLSGEVEQRIPQWDFSRCVQCGACGRVCQSNAIAALRGKNPIFMPEQCNGCGACALVCKQNAIGWTKKNIGQIYTGRNYKIDLLSGELKANEAISEFIVNALNKIIGQKKADYDYIIIDTAAGTHCPVVAALENCDLALLIAEPTPLSAHDLGLMLELAEKIAIKKSIIINRSDIGAKTSVEELAKKYQTKIIAEMPYSKTIARQCAEGKPIENKNIKQIIDLIK